VVYVIGAREMTDGTTRQVLEEEDGRQFILDDDGLPVYGVWLLPDEPTAFDRP
jgi:hypothetical protein